MRQASATSVQTTTVKRLRQQVRGAGPGAASRLQCLAPVAPFGPAPPRQACPAAGCGLPCTHMLACCCCVPARLGPHGPR